MSAEKMDPQKDATQAARGIERGSGLPEEGSIYLECGTCPSGFHISNFFLDPPEPSNSHNKRSHNVRLRTATGTHHVFDWVRRGNYPTPADLLAEIEAHGALRRTNRSLDFEKLGSDSRLLLVHPRAIPKVPQELRQIESILSLRCREDYRKRCLVYRRSGGHAHHLNATNAMMPCSRWYYLDAGYDEAHYDEALYDEAHGGAKRAEENAGKAAAPRKTAALEDLSESERERVAPFVTGKSGEEGSGGKALRPTGTRELSSTAFTTHGGPRIGRLTGPLRIEMKPGIVASLPITNALVTKAPGGSHKQLAEDLMGRADLPIRIAKGARGEAKRT
jgi:hypothetical protein